MSIISFVMAAAVSVDAIVASPVSVERVFRSERFSRGDTNISRLQPLDDASWLKLPAAYCRYRRDFDTTGGVARIDVSADERFVLMLDGQVVARGPNRGDINNWQYQTYDLTLEPGAHRLDAIVWRIGEDAPFAQLSWTGGFVLKAEGPFDSLLTTGIADWRVGVLNGTVGDRTLEQAGAWGVGSSFRVVGTGLLDEEPSSWQAVEVVRKPLAPRGTGWRVQGWMPYPSQIEDQIERRIRPGSFKISPTGKIFQSFDIPAHSKVELLWDLENYYCAYPVLAADGGKGAKISWGWAESMRNEDADGLKCRNRGEWQGKRFLGFTDVFVSDGRKGASFTTPWWRCGRWCRIQIETVDEPLAVRDLAIIESRYPLEDEGHFTCDDVSLTPVRRLCARGMQMCAHEMLFDCPFYEQQMYPGDTRVQLRVLAGMSGDDRMIRRAIEIFDYARRDDGTVPMNYPTRGLQESVTYSLCQVMMYADYVRYHDNVDWLKARIPGMRQTLDGISRFENADGLLENLPGWSFSDWVQSWKLGIAPDGASTKPNAFNNLYWVMTLNGAAAVERALGEPERAAIWERKAQRAMAAVVRLFWDEKRSLFADTVRHDCYSEHAQCLAILSGALPRERSERIFKAMLAADDLARCTVYFSYYLFETYFAFDRGDLFLKRLDLWRDYAARDFKTPMEAPDTGKNGQKESRSDCHAWGSHPIVFMQRGLAGIESAAPFYRKVRVAPSPGSLHRIESRSPHPKGFVSVDLSFKDGVASGRVTLPFGVDGIFVWKGQEIPLHPGDNKVHTERTVDVLVVGGTSEGVSAAVAASKNGANTLLVTPYPYLGEDLVGTLELELPDSDGKLPPLVEKLATDEKGMAEYDYWPDRKTPHPRAVFNNDRWERFSEPLPPKTPSDCVYYESDLNCRCLLRKPARISTVEVSVLEKPRLGPDSEKAHESVHAGSVMVGFQKAAADGASRTQSVSLEFLAGPRRGEKIELQREARSVRIPGDTGYREMQMVVFSGKVDCELSEVMIHVRKDPSAHSQCLSRIGFRRAEAERVFASPTPLKVMRTYDRELIGAGVDFMTGTAVRRVQYDDKNEIVAVEVVNRSGRQWIRAGKTIDTTLDRVCSVSVDNGTLQTNVFSRIVMTDGERPSAPGLSVEPLSAHYTIYHVGTNDCVVTGTFYRCTAELAMPDRTYPSRASAEWEMRRRTWCRGIIDDADILVDRSVRNTKLDERIRQGSDLGSAAAREVQAKSCRSAVSTSSLPTWGEYDVVVVGGGTAGAPAAIAAAKAGAKTLLVEYLGILGGTGTDGMILGYYDGNFCGVTQRFFEENERTGGHYGQYARAGTLLQWCKEAGVTVWFGAMGTGAVVEDGRVVGVELATPQGCGTVRARCVIDATGNSDIAAAAGAETFPAFVGEFARQSAGECPHRLARGSINSDFGYVNDSSARDVWLFGVRARAGAPNAWDLARLPGSRERRRIMPDYMINAMDVNACRSYPDTVVQAQSRQDSHGYLTDDFRFISSASAQYRLVGVDHRYMFDVNVPLRSLLPKGLSGIAVVGLGSGVARDVLPMVRMQADLMNMGYSVGLVAAQAARQGGDFRNLDWQPLREEMVKEGILRDEVLNWKTDVDVSSDAVLQSAVKAMRRDFEQSHVLYRPENRSRALPLLRRAYLKETEISARQAYALVLGLMGDPTGADSLAEVVSGAVPIACSKERLAAFGGGVSDMTAFMIALGRTRSECANGPLLMKFKSVNGTLSMLGFRPYCLSAVELGDPVLAPELERFLDLPGVSGHAVGDWKTLSPTGGYGHGSVEYDEAVRELGIVRALVACGDPSGRGRKVLEDYVNDPRGVLSAHARAILSAIR